MSRCVFCRDLNRKQPACCGLNLLVDGYVVQVRGRIAQPEFMRAREWTARLRMVSDQGRFDQSQSQNNHNARDRDSFHIMAFWESAHFRIIDV